MTMTNKEGIVIPTPAERPRDLENAVNDFLNCYQVTATVTVFMDVCEYIAVVVYEQV